MDACWRPFACRLALPRTGGAVSLVLHQSMCQPCDGARIRSVDLQNCRSFSAWRLDDRVVWWSSFFFPSDLAARIHLPRTPAFFSTSFLGRSLVVSLIVGLVQSLFCVEVASTHRRRSTRYSSVEQKLCSNIIQDVIRSRVR